jgi:hypothetical protein
MNGLPPPKPIMLKERSSMIFVEYGQLDVIDGAFVLEDVKGIRAQIPVATLACIMIQPGVTVTRIIPFIPSPKAKPFKRWLVKVGYERVQEIEDPELAIKRTRHQ